MGAHVWGPQYLMDHLLPHFRLTGWTPDWYAGFPAYVFYMVVPSLLIVLIHVGPPLWLSPFLLAGLGGTGVARPPAGPVDGARRPFLWICLAILALMSVPVPYNVAFKLVTVSGLVTLPLAVFALGRAAKLPFPVAPILALGAAAVPLRECASRSWAATSSRPKPVSSPSRSRSRSPSSTWRWSSRASAPAATVRSGRRCSRSTICCHLIPAIFAVIATVVIVFLRREDRTPWWDGSTIGRVIASAAVADHAASSSPSRPGVRRSRSSAPSSPSCCSCRSTSGRSSSRPSRFRSADCSHRSGSCPST